MNNLRCGRRTFTGSVDSVRLENALLAAFQLESRLQCVHVGHVSVASMRILTRVSRLYDVAACVPQFHYTSGLPGSSNLTVMVCRSRESSNGHIRKLFVLWSEETWRAEAASTRTQRLPSRDISALANCNVVMFALHAKVVNIPRWLSQRLTAITSFGPLQLRLRHVNDSVPTNVS